MIIFCSFLGNTLLLCFIKCNRKLQTHPMKIFMAIAFFDACYFWTLFIDRFMCYLEINKIFAYTIFWKDDEQSIYVATKTLQYTTSIVYAFTYVTSLNLNACVCLDLLLMLTNPFKKSEARYFPFLYGSIFVGVIETSAQIY